MPPELHPHQEDAVSKLGNGKVLKGGVGTGKSITAVAYYVRNESPRPIYVITTAKKRNSLDWEKEFAAWAIGKTPDATVAGILTVDSWNNIGKYTDVRDAFFIFDEQRAVGSGAWADAIVKIARKNRWIMLSATPGDTWLDYVPLFMANGFYPNRTAFIREHVEYDRYAKYPKVRRYHGVGKLVRYKNQLIVDMPYERHTTRDVKEVFLAHDTEALERVLKKRWNVFENKPLRDMAELFGVARKVVNSDRSRLEYVQSLMDSVPRLIVFYNFDYELEMLRTLGDWRPTMDVSASSRTTTPNSSSSGSGTTSSRTTSSMQKRSETRSSSEPGEDYRSSGTTPAATTPSSVTSLNSRSLKRDSESSTRSSECQNEQTPTPVSTTLPGSTQTRSSTSSSSAAAVMQLSTTASRTSSTGPTTATTSTSSVVPASESSAEWTDTNQSSSSTTSGSMTTGPATGSGGSSHTTATTSCVSSTSDSGGSSTSETSSETFSLAEWNGHKHQDVPTTDRWVYLVQYTAGAEGWNCITTDTIVFWSLTYSYKMWHQAFGRIDRLNTPFTELHYHVLQSNSWIDQAVRKSLSEKKNFNEGKYRTKFVD